MDECEDGPLREAITWAAALGFLAGGLARLTLGSMDRYGMLKGAVTVPFGAMAAAFVAGILINLMALPALARVIPGHRLPHAAYRAAGVLCWFAAFAGAYQFGSPGA